MRLVEALALTPALSPRRGGTIRQRFEKTPFSDRRETGERCSLSPGERAGVRASAFAHYMDTAKEDTLRSDPGLRRLRVYEAPYRSSGNRHEGSPNVRQMNQAEA